MGNWTGNMGPMMGSVHNTKCKTHKKTLVKNSVIVVIAGIVFFGTLMGIIGQGTVRHLLFFIIVVNSLRLRRKCNDVIFSW